MKLSHFAASTTAILLLLLLLAPSSEATITCGQAVGYLKPCLTYLKGGTGGPSSSCCAGANALKNAASTPDDRRTACDCIKTVAQSIKPNPKNAEALPNKCGISLPFSISPNLDCSKIA